MQRDLARAGFITNIAKCHWELSTSYCTWLGFDINLMAGKVAVPPCKVERLKAQLKGVASEGSVNARQLASVIGKIISISLAVGPVAILMTRSLYVLLNTRACWCEQLRIDSEARKELQFCVNELENFNGQNIWHSASAIRIVCTDVSDTG